MTTPEPHPILCLRRILPATPQEVFNAWTDPESLGEWLCPGAMVLAEVRLDEGRRAVFFCHERSEWHLRIPVNIGRFNLRGSWSTGDPLAHTEKTRS
jgi:uncharacterized protein YndB with AHSA1/START domain